MHWNIINYIINNCHYIFNEINTMHCVIDIVGNKLDDNR